MKIRYDFVTNSSSSSYLVTLRIENKDGVVMKLEGGIYEPEQGYIQYVGIDNAIDPRVLSNASSIKEFEKMLSSFSTLCGKEFSCSDLSILPEEVRKDEEYEEDEDYEDDWEDYNGDKKYDKFIQAIDACIKTPDDIKTISLSCVGEEDAYDLKAKVFEQYVFDRTTGNFSINRKAVENGEDITDKMLDYNYSVDCGDDVLEFQFKFK